MSSDFNIKQTDLMKAGVGFYEEFDETYEKNLMYANFPGREYSREISIVEDEILISCSGQFRQWLEEFLKERKINYTKH